MRKRSRIGSTEGWPKEKAFLPGEKTMIAISAPHRVQSSLAFLKRPERRLEKVTWRLLSLSIFSILIFWRPLLLLTIFRSSRTNLEPSRIEENENERHGDKEYWHWAFIGCPYARKSVLSCPALLSFGCQCVLLVWLY